MRPGTALRLFTRASVCAASSRVDTLGDDSAWIRSSTRSARAVHVVSRPSTSTNHRVITLQTLPAGPEGLGCRWITLFQPRIDQSIHVFRVGFALGSPHDLADQESALLCQAPFADIGHNGGVIREHPFDNGRKCVFVFQCDQALTLGNRARRLALLEHPLNQRLPDLAADHAL